jgi:hypothetical protein
MRKPTSSEFLYSWQLRSGVDGYHSAGLRSSADTVAWQVEAVPRTVSAEQRQPHRGEKRIMTARRLVWWKSGRRRPVRTVKFTRSTSRQNCGSYVVTPPPVNSNKILRNFGNCFESTRTTHPIRIFISTYMRTSNLAIYIYIYIYIQYFFIDNAHPELFRHSV